MSKYKNPTNNEELEGLKWKMSYLENMLTGELTNEQFEIRKEISEIKELIGKVEPQRPTDSNFECFGCGS